MTVHVVMLRFEGKVFNLHEVIRVCETKAVAEREIASVIAEERKNYNLGEGYRDDKGTYYPRADRDNYSILREIVVS